MWALFIFLLSVNIADAPSEHHKLYFKENWTKTQDAGMQHPAVSQN